LRSKDESEVPGRALDLTFDEWRYAISGDDPDVKIEALIARGAGGSVNYPCLMFSSVYAGAPPRAPGSGGVTSGAATTCLGGFSAGIF
jgi:hypothetical protein